MAAAPELIYGVDADRDVSYEAGGLMILENSHRQTDRIHKYLNRTWMRIARIARTHRKSKRAEKRAELDGRLSSDPISLREKLGGRWLTTEFRRATC